MAGGQKLTFKIFGVLADKNLRGVGLKFGGFVEWNFKILFSAKSLTGAGAVIKND